MDDSPQRNPYRPGKPRFAGADAAKRPIGLLIAAALEAWTAVYSAVTAPTTLTEFEKMFAGFGTELPDATRTVLGAPWICWIFAVVALAQLAWIALRKQPSSAEKARMKASLWTFGVVFGAAMAWALYGIYSAIFKLGAAV